MMKSFHKPMVGDAKDIDEVTLISVLLGLFSAILIIAFTISYVGGY